MFVPLYIVEIVIEIEMEMETADGQWLGVGSATAP
jgi:hypothetical protein